MGGASAIHGLATLASGHAWSKSGMVTPGKVELERRSDAMVACYTDTFRMDERNRSLRMKRTFISISVIEI